MVLARDGRRCQLQMDVCTTVATHVHHLVAREVAGDDPAHLVAACAPCNLKTGDPNRHDPEPNVRAWW
jgi:5-methylcytosine-specific restriction endonuclease McrA